MMEFRQSQTEDLDQIVRIERAGFVPCGELVLDRCEEAGDPRIGYERILE